MLGIALSENRLSLCTNDDGEMPTFFGFAIVVVGENCWSMNVLQYAAIEQQKFSSVMAELGYEVKTTFFSDFSTAEFCSGAEGVRDTYNRAWASWQTNYEYLTELVMVLNHKIWEHYKTNKPLASVYDELWRKADNDFHTLFADNEEAKDYYYRVTD